MLPIDMPIRAKIDADVNAALRTNHCEGATIAIVDGATTVYSRGYGLRDVDGGLPADVQTHYEVGSITKQFAAAAIVQLKEAGKLNLDARMATYLPTAPHATEITVRELLTQTSGLADFITAPNIESLVGTPTTFDAVVARIGDKPLDFKPGTQWEYSSTNYLILGRIVEVLSGETWENYAHDHLFLPAGMTSTATIAQESALPDMARGYAYGNGQNAPSVPVDESWAGAAGGIVTTVGDLTTWHAALASGKIVSPDDYALLTAPARFPDGSNAEYAFGLYVDTYDGQPRIWHSGNTFGFDASDQFFPKQDVRIVAMTNSADCQSNELVAHIYNDLFPAIASEARNGAAGVDPDLAGKFTLQPLPVSASMAPLTIYRSALARMRSVTAPAYLQFKLQATTAFSGSIVIQHFVGVERTADRKRKFRDVDAVIQRNVWPFELAPDLFLGHTGLATPAPSANEFTFGLDETSTKPLSTIATVTSNSRYSVTLDGVEDLQGCGHALHLKLKPLQDPMRYNLRELWVDASDARICKATGVWFATVERKKIVATIALDLNADGLINHYRTSVSARFLVLTVSGRQDGSINDIRSVSDTVWSAATTTVPPSWAH